MIIGVIIGVALTLGVLLLLYFYVFKNNIEKNSKASFEGLAAKVFEEKISSFLNISSKVLGDKKQEIDQNLKEKEDKFGELVQQIRKELGEHQAHMNKTEIERIKTFTILQQELSKHGEIANELKISTSKLNQILSNSKLRGRHGERVAEDIIKAAGLIEGTHYKKNKKQETAPTRPDFTFLLPNGFKINMDVKFPLDNFLKIMQADSSDDQENLPGYKKSFLNDIKDKIGEVTSRDYINPQENTLDFVILFIPNENIASFINETFPELFNVAIEKRVIFTSPYQLIGFISLIRQSFENFYYEESLKRILGLITDFSKRYDAFKERFLGLGDKIEKVESSYDDLKDKSFKHLDLVIGKIEKHKSGLPVEQIEETVGQPPSLIAPSDE